MKFTNKNNLPDPVVRALTSYEKGEKVEGLRVTTLIDSPRISQLRKEFAADITEDVSDMVWKVMGTAIHEVFEKAASNSYVSEERLSHEVNGTVISGAIDYQFEDDGEIDLKDYKSTSVYSVLMGDKPEWEKQINTYAYLIRHAKGLKVRSASVVAVLRDWRKSDPGDQDARERCYVAITLLDKLQDKMGEYMNAGRLASDVFDKERR